MNSNNDNLYLWMIGGKLDDGEQPYRCSLSKRKNAFYQIHEQSKNTMIPSCILHTVAATLKRATINNKMLSLQKISLFTMHNCL